ncbi:DUF5979 domain-containing protein [Corynebacterium glucuronolyticum]|uniref:DUF5979 domain-containing protein n=1 Tax=Corynebacterium glucuronolyticum TaxID=39791 RepID=UPI00223B670D|nr:DUF5979 domain-containing protein [Corynebacterium glucuronolyticum]MCT1442825.1 DUF5979 domain-containing protein [Corynebacterium glucuronolyticum]
MTRRTFASIAAVIMLVLSVIGVPFTAQAQQPASPRFGATQVCAANPVGPQPLKGLAVLIDMASTGTYRYNINDDYLDELRDQLRTLIWDYSQRGGDFVTVYTFATQSPPQFTTDFVSKWEAQFSNIRKDLDSSTAATINWNPSNDNFYSVLPLKGRTPPIRQERQLHHHNWEAAMNRVVADQQAGWMYTDVINIVGMGPTESENSADNPTAFWLGPPKTRAVDYFAYMESKKKAEQGGAVIQTVGITPSIYDNQNYQWWSEDTKTEVKDPRLPVKAHDLLHKASSSGTYTGSGIYGKFMGGLNAPVLLPGEPSWGGNPHLRGGGLPGLDKVARTCLTLSVGIDDGSGGVTLDTSKREFDITSPLKTSFDADPAAPYTITSEGGFASLPLAYRVQDFSATLRSVADDLATDTPPVCYASDDGTTWTPLDVGDSRGISLALTVPKAKKINCQFTVRKVTSVQLEKVVTADPNIQNELDSDRYGQYHFAYKCVDEKSGFKIEGLFSPVRRNRYDQDHNLIPPLEGDVQLPAALPQQVPIGATCTITELEPRISEGYFSVDTTWDVTGGSLVSTSQTSSFPVATVREREPVGECGLTSCERTWVDRDTTASTHNPTVTFTVNKDAHVRAVNTYKSPKTLFKASASVKEPDKLGKDLPSSVDITYSCRYIPSADKRPEIAANPEQYPVVVGSGKKPVPVSADGHVEATLGEFPVGTQCEINTIAASGRKEDPLIPGYSLNTAWSSRSCMKQQPSDPGYTPTARECKANYIYAYSTGDGGAPIATEMVDGTPMDVHAVHADLTFTRNTRAVGVTKKLAGRAADDVVTKTFDATLTCVDQKYPETVTAHHTLTLTPNATQNVEVPVRSNCTVAEKPESLTGADKLTITPPPNQTVPVEIESSAPIAVDITNTVEDRYGTFRWTYKPTTDPQDDPLPAETLDKINALPMDFSTTCLLPDNTSFTVENKAVMPNSTFSVDVPQSAAGTRWITGQGLPYGTMCRTTGTAPDMTGVEAQIRPPAKTNKLGKEIAINGDETNDATVVFERKTTSLYITVNDSQPQVDDADYYMPPSYDLDVVCSLNGASKQHTWYTVTPGNPTVRVDGINEGRTCTITVTDPQDAKWKEVFNRTTTFTTGPPANIRMSIPVGPDDNPADGVSVTGTDNSVSFSGEIYVGNGAATLQVTHTYTPAMQKLTVNKEFSAVDDTGTTVDGPLATAIFGAAPSFPATVTCTRNGADVSRSVTLAQGAPATVDVPVGAECTVAETPTAYPATGAPEVTYDGAPSATPWTVTRGQDKTTTVKNAYTVKTGSVNLKKKVDGTGVQTVNGGRKFKVDYRCTLGEWEKTGKFETTRFDSAPDFAVTGVPQGADCTFTEDPATSRNPEDTSGPNNTGDPKKEKDAYYSHWETRWNVTQDTLGFATEQLCSSLSNCSVASTHEAQAHFAIAKPGFNGTVVLWNTYDYTKVPLELEKKLGGDGVLLNQHGKLGDFVVDYSCTHPSWATSGLAEKSFIPDPTISGTARFPAGGGTVTVDKPIPGNFVCSVKERQVDSFGGTVTVGYEGASDVQLASSGAPGMVNDQAQFMISKELAKSSEKKVQPDGTHEWISTGTQKISLTNNYERPRAPLSAQFGYLTGMDGDVSPWITDPDGGVNATWECTDPDMPEVKTSGTTKLTPGAPAELNPTLVVGSACTLSIDAQAKVPAGPAVTVTETKKQYGGDPLVERGRVDGDSLLSLVAGANRVDVEASYVVPQINLSLHKEVVGDDAKEIIGADHKLPFTYTCDFHNLVGSQPEPFPATGEFGLTRGGSWDQTVPTGSTCTVTESAPPAELAARLAAGGRKMSPYTVVGETNVPGGQVALNAERPSVTMVNAIYRTDAEIQVQKVQADLTTALEGSQFAIYEATQDGMAATPVATMASVAGEAGKPGPAGRFTARLKPGTYYLVETHAPAGAALLPGAWKFTVNAVNDPKREFADLQIELAARTENSGLVTVTEAKPEAGKPAMIQVANILQGKLPLTGSYGVFWWILGGLVLIGAGLVWRRRSNEKH